MKKKVISTVLCAAMVASMFAGCGNKAANNSTADNSAATMQQRAVMQLQQQKQAMQLQRQRQHQLPMMQSQI